MKKSMILFTVIFACINILIVEQVDAKQCSSILQGTELNQGYPTNRGNVVYLNTSDTVCKGKNTEVWFSGFGTLPSWHAGGPSAVLYADLFDEDQPYSTDDFIKEYFGGFEGRVLTTFYLQSTIKPEAFENEGDTRCELYMQFHISGVIGGDPIPQGLFYYQMCMN